MRSQATLRLGGCATIAWLVLSTAALAAPAITNLTPRGLQIGKPTKLVITGTDLAEDLQLVSDARFAVQQVKSGTKSNRVEIEVTIDAATQPGIYAVRVANAGGISSPVLLGIDRLPQRAFGVSLNELPAAFSGAVDGAQVLQATLTGSKDQRLIIDIEAQRLGSGLKPVLRLND